MANDADGADPVARLHASRNELKNLGHILKGDAGSDDPAAGAQGRDEFPRSHVMRTLLRHRRGLGMGAAALGLLWLRPRLLFNAARWVATQPMARRLVLPLVMRKLKGR